MVFLNICINILMKKGNSFFSSDVSTYYVSNFEAKNFHKILEKVPVFTLSHEKKRAGH